MPKAKNMGTPCTTTSVTMVGGGNWDMVQVAEVQAKDKRDLHATERKYVEDLDATLNRQVPTKTRKQYYDDHKTEIIDRVKQYYQDHKAERRAYLDSVIECECGLTSTRSHFSRHKRTQRHKDRMAALEE